MHDIAQADKSFGSFLVQSQRISTLSFDRAYHLARETGDSVETLLTKLGLISEKIFAEALSEFLQIELVSRHEFPDTPVALNLFNQKFLRQSRIVPLVDTPDAITLGRVPLGDPVVMLVHGGLLCDV